MKFTKHTHYHLQGKTIIITYQRITF